MPWPWGERIPEFGSVSTSGVVRVAERPTMDLPAIKRRHGKWHESMRGATWAAPPPPCDVCWLIDQIEGS